MTEPTDLELLQFRLQKDGERVQTRLMQAGELDVDLESVVQLELMLEFTYAMEDAADKLIDSLTKIKEAK